MLTRELADVGDLSGASGPWWVSAGGIVVGIITAVSPFAWQKWRDSRAAADTTTGATGLNSAAVVATVTEATKPHGMSGVQLTAMLETVGAMSDRLESVETQLDAAKRKIAELERHDSQRQWAYDQAIAWGINATGPTPRVVPPFLAQFMTNPPGSQQ